MRKTRSQIINQVRLSLLLIRPSPTPISENRTHQPATQQHTNNTNNRHPQSRRHTPTRQDTPSNETHQVPAVTVVLDDDRKRTAKRCAVRS